MKKIFSHTTQISGVLFAILAFFSFITLVSYNVNSLPSWVAFGGYAAMSYCMFAKKHDVVSVGAVSAIAGGLFVQFVIFIISHIRYHAPFAEYSISFWTELLIMLSFVALALFAIATITGKLEQYLDIFEKVWYAPAVMRGLAMVLQFYSASQNRYFYFWEGLTLIIGGLIAVFAVLLASVWFLFHDRLPEPDPKVPDGPEGYIKMVKHILLLLFTFCIWWFIWIYRTTKYLNLANNEEPRKPVTELLLCLFIPFYIVYWNYKSALRVDHLLEQNGLGPNIGNVTIFWSIFAGFLVPILMQDSINKLALSYAAYYNDIPESFYHFNEEAYANNL